MDAIASIAAASTLDDNTLSIRPELVIDDTCTIKPSSKDSFFDGATRDEYESDESEESSSEGSSYYDSEEDSSSYESDEEDDGYSRQSSIQDSWNFR